MRAIILTCGTGGGHNSAAQAVTEAIQANAWDAEQVDFLKLCGPAFDKALGQSYINLVKMAPALFGAVYGLGESISAYDRHSPVYALNAMLSGPLEALLRDRPADALVFTHLYPAEAATYLREKGRLRAKTVAVATDYTCIPFWEETRCDWYISPHPDCLDEYASHGMRKDNILPYGIPVRESFSVAYDREECRRALQLQDARRVYLIMGGSMGFGQIPTLVGALLRRIEPTDRVLVVCGSDERLYKRMKERFGHVRQVRPIGFTRDVASYMAVSDVLFTKPGGLSSTEAAVVGVPMVHTEPIPGCETRNLAFFGQHGMSVTARGAEGLADEGVRLAASPERCERMRACQAANCVPDSARRIAALVDTICREEKDT